MIVSLAFLALFLAVAYVQSTYGFFSALLMAVMTLCCAAAAVGTHEYVAVHYLAPYWQPDYAHGIALAAIFGIPLILFRLLFDQLIRRNCLLSLWPDRMGAGFCGAITGIVVAGILAHAVQSLPFGPSILGFARIDVSPKEKKGDAPDPKPPKLDAAEDDLWVTPDRFAVATASLLSAGVFSGNALLAMDQPDLVQAVGWINATPPEIGHFAAKGAVAVVRSATVPFVFDFTPGDDKKQQAPKWDSIQPAAGREFRMLRVQLREPNAREMKHPMAFTPRQFRLVGRQQERVRQYFPIAVQQDDARQPVNRHIRSKSTRYGLWPVVDDVMVPREGNNDQVELVFELPSGFQPTYLAFRRGARTPVDFNAKDAPPEESAAPKSEETAAATEPSTPPRTADAGSPRTRTRGGGEASSGEQPPRRTRGQEDAAEGRGGSRGIGANAALSFFGDRLPQELKAYQQDNLEVSRGGRIASGKLVAFLPDQQGGTQPTISGFEVPEDKRLLHLSVTRLHARSGLGKALSRAAAVAQNYLVQDDRGNRHKLVGKYVTATVEDKQVFELQYFKEDVGSVGGIGPFNRVKDEHLKADHEMFLLFLVDPGTTIVSFSTGSDATQGDDLREENLTAPP